MDLARFFEIVKRWWWLVIICVALAAGTSYVYSEQQPRIYASRTTLMVGTGIQNPNPNEGELGLSRTLAEIYAQLVVRRPITMAVIDRLGLEMTPEQLAKMVQTNVIPNAQLLEITVLDTDPSRARILADAVANELILQSPSGPQGQQERQTFIQSQLNSLQAKIEEADRQIKELEDSILTMTSAVEISEAQSRISELERLKTDYQANYAQLLSYLSESSINQLAIVERATESSYPIAPNVKLNVAVAAAAGLGLAVLAILLLEFFDDTVMWRGGEIRTVVGLPLLGGVGKRGRGDDKVVARDGLWSPEADALRNIRSNIYLVASEQRPSSLLITSPLPEAGKSLVAANLAAIIASAGGSAVLVDADFRKPSLHHLFDMPNVFGLADVLTKPEAELDAALERVIRPTDIDNLFLLPAGKLPADPTYLLGLPVLDRVLERLQQKADFIIVDSGPLLTHPDPVLLATHLDGVILVAWDRRTTRSNIKKAIERMDVIEPTKLLGVVFNGVSLPQDRFYAYSRAAFRPAWGNEAVTKKQGVLGWLSRGTRDSSIETADGEALLSLSDVSEYLGVAESTAKRWCEEGRIPATRVGRQWQIKLADLTEFAQT